MDMVDKHSILLMTPGGQSGQMEKRVNEASSCLIIARLICGKRRVERVCSPILQRMSSMAKSSGSF